MTKRRTKSEITYGRTPMGQLLYDLGFTKLKPPYLARKHRLPVRHIRHLRKQVLDALKPKQRSAR